MIINLLNPGDYDKKLNAVLFVLRIAVGALMLTHGIGKFSALFDSEPIQFPDPIGIGAAASLALTVFAEVFCSIFLIVGVGTRFAAISLLITMLVAALIFHANDPFGKQELPLLYVCIYMVIAVAGAGKISIDNWLHTKIST
ncbi:MAG: DoxX family protein [Bacteroidetes bacterium]|nr:MAG: DoxX family protein [Bacteroidota bacterium]MBL1145301.1 DoxX family protein [Bacteroidota bacterium]MCB0803783.1 DoxX family protein [Flavobacteriales bacterium]NOG58098.1 DoxX family protein [Bacteroidota bacterium]